MTDQIIKKEDKLFYKGSNIFKKQGSLVLAQNELYFLEGTDKIFYIFLNQIVSVNSQKGIGNGVDWLIITYNENGNEQKARIMHFGFINAFGLGMLSRLQSSYFTSWEQAINDVRFRVGENNNTNISDLEKLAELKDKGIITEEEFKAKKKQLLGL